MRRLYWKIFLAFWMVMALVLATNLAVTWFQYRLFKTSEESAHISELAFEAAEIFESQGPAALKAWKDQLQRRTDLRVLLLNQYNQPVNGRQLPPRLRHYLERSLKPERRAGPDFEDMDEAKDHRHRPSLFREHRERPILWPITSGTGNRYLFIIFNPHELVDHLYASTTILWRIGISFLIVAGFALLLTHYLVKPVRMLQTASRKLAGGDLHTRVAEAIGDRRDELGELGRDFDTMAQRIQGLVQGQQQMLRDVSHELRTPLARLRVALELARKRQGETGELDRMERETERINQLIDEILSLVRLDLRPEALNHERVNLVDLVAPMVQDANFEQPRVVLQAPAELNASVDAKLIYRAIENILCNALKYSDGEVELLLEQAEGKTRIRVRDRGPGVDEAQLSRLFEPFYRTDAAREPGTGGYGLGLAIAEKAVRLHQGEILAVNRPEGGLEVQIVLPA